MILPAHGTERFNVWAPDAQTVTLLAGGREYPMARVPGAATAPCLATLTAPAAGGPHRTPPLPGTWTTAT